MSTIKEKLPSTSSQSSALRLIIVPCTCKLAPSLYLPDIASSTETYVDCSVTESETATPVATNSEKANNPLDQAGQGAVVLLEVLIWLFSS